MKKYGQADVMCAIVHIFLERQEKLNDEQKKKIEDRCCSLIIADYPTAADLEVGR